MGAPPRNKATASGSDLSKSGHTPGPWEVKSYDTTYQVYAGKINIVSTSWHSYQRVVYPLKDEARANAILAAAAPDLLSSLRDFLDNPLFQVSVGGNPIAVEGMLARARAAVAKATGGQK